MRSRGSWVRTWGASPQAADAALGSLEDQSPLRDVTLRQVVRISGGGQQIRLRLSNEYGTAPLAVSAVRVGLAVPGGGVSPGSNHAVSFGGRRCGTIPAGAALLSDPVDLHVAALATLSVSIHLPDAVEPVTCHDPALDTGWRIPGNHVAAASLPADAEPLPARVLLSAVDALAAGSPTTIVTLGDSRVDGAGSTMDAHKAWPDLLAERLNLRGTGFVSNQGISGNRLLHDGIGPSALARLDRDVLDTPGLGHVVVAIGGNDLAVAFAPRDEHLADFLAMFPGEPVSVDDVIAGYRRLVSRLHEHDVNAYAATIPPYEGADMYSMAGEQAREAVNSWIRTGGEFDAVLDFDAVWRDPGHPGRILDGLHAGDHLHGSDVGYQALADSIDISLFD